MNSRERFDKVRSQQRNRFSLRTRLTAVVTLEMLVCVGAGYGLDRLFNHVFPNSWKVPLLLELAVMSLVVGIFVTGVMSRYFFNPIKKLRRAMDQVAAGNYTVRLEDQSTSKEIMEIYTGFNLMVHELSATEILQSDFVSNVSHEIRTPVNAIEGYSTLLQEDASLSAPQREYVDKILFNTQRLSSLVGSILLLSRLENQQIPTGQTIFRLDEQIRQSLVALENNWLLKDIRLDVELERVRFRGNEPMLRHIWDNLLSNAFKFTPAGSTVIIRLCMDGDVIRFTLDDEGPGLSPEAQKRIFDKFYQGDNSHRQEGNGLGLALVKRIVTLEKGSVFAQNLPGKGCRFTVLLPKNESAG